MSSSSILFRTFVPMTKLFALKNFEELGINPKIVKGLTELNIIKPSDIQKKVIPVLLAGKTDIVAQAQTGTGKTVAFGLPLIEQMDPKSDSIQGLILAPTRELAKQVAKQLFKFNILINYLLKLFSVVSTLIFKFQNCKDLHRLLLRLQVD